jgi:polysaccharide chain length determinant protein (PEP-CTERM system associated)
MENTPDFDARRYVELLLRKKYIVLSVAIGVLSLFTWGSFFLPKVYEASSTVLIEKNSIIEPLMKGVGVASGGEDRLSNLKNSITSRSIIEKVLKKLGLDAAAKTEGQKERMIDAFRKNLGITVQGARQSGTDLFTVSYRGNDPIVVRDVVNTTVQEYIDETLGFRRTDVSGAFEFIQGQLMEYKARLEESDKAIREFRERNPNMVPQSETSVIGRIENYQTGKIEAEIKLKELIRKRENLQKQLSGEKELTVTFMTNEGSPQGRLNYLNGQLVLLTSKFTDNYPEVIKVKREIEELKRQIAQAKISQTPGTGSETATMNPIYQQLREESARADAEIESLRARAAELSRQQHEGERILTRMPKEQEEWTKLQRDRNVYQKIYDELLQKLESARVSQDLEISDKSGAFKILDAAIAPSLPIKPNRVQMILLGLLAGAAAGIGTVIAMDSMNKSFKNAASIETGLKLPVLATIPKIVTEKDRLHAMKIDKQVFTAAGAYLMIVGVVLIMEFLYRYMGIRLVNF